MDETFPVSALNPALAGDAEAVVRLDDREFAVRSPGNARLTVHRVITIRRSEGRSHGRLVLPYDKFRRIQSLKGRIRDASGEVVRRLTDADTKDYSAISDFSLYEDHRVRVAELYHSRYPYTVEFEYEIAYDGLLSWPTWRPQSSSDVAVEHARFVARVPDDLTFRHRVRTQARQSGSGSTVAARSSSVFDYATWEEEGSLFQGPRTVYRWTAAALASGTREPAAPSWARIAPTLFLAPNTFEIEGTTGSMASWRQFGQWYHQLTQGRQQLPDEAVATVQALVDTIDTPRNKVRAVYRYMQDRTRYVSVQLGLGGWQPFGADYVHRRKYGDCKALSNYMQALLEAVDVSAHPVLIYSGVQHAKQVTPDFVRNAFNHMVLAVPLARDTLWLESTSQTAPFGHVPASIEDRHALLVTPEGGELVHIPQSSATANRQVRRATVTLRPNGHAQARIETRYTGNQQDRIRTRLARATPREKRKWLRSRLAVPNVEVRTADFSDASARQLTATLPVTVDLARYASSTGSRLFVPLPLAERWTHVPAPVTGRTQPVVLSPYPYADTDTIRYRLPDGYAVEALPDSVVAQTDFARYKAHAEVQSDGIVRYVRHLTLRATRLPAEQYAAYRRFAQTVARADRAQMVLVKQDT
jgi:hypothetical protein